MLSKLMNSRYEQNDEILILYNTTHSKREQDILVKEQGEETYEHFNASNHISYRKPVVNEIEGNIASKEQAHGSTDNTSLTKCLYCQTMFPYSLVELHAQTCIGNAANQTAGNVEENLKRCEYCRSIFPDSLLEQHTQTCSIRKIHQCSECNKMFRIRSKLLIHQQSHSDERLHSCNICARTFKFKSGLTRHMKQQHSGRDTTEVKTTLCEELQGLEYCSLQDDINDRKEGDQDENSVKEGKNFGRQHFDKPKTAVARQKVECGSLLDAVNQQTSNDHHMVVYGNRHEKYKENNFVKQHSDAATIDRKTPRQGQENSSYSQKRNDQDSFKENVHRKSTISNIRETFRKDTHSFEIEQKYLKRNNAAKCEENDRELNFEAGLEPSGIFNECCPSVTPPFHMRSCGDSKVYKCQECPRIFAKPSRLVIHSRTHSNEKLFTCVICQQTFKYKGSLNRHVKEQHYGQGRKSFSMVIDERPRKEPENCSSVGKMELRNDLMDVDESNGGVFRHWKERHYGQGRFSMVMDERNELENRTFLEKTNFENDDECLVSLKKSLEDKDGGEESLSKIVVERKQNCSSWEKIKFQNDDQNLMKQHEDLENEETRGKSLDEGQNVNFRQDGKTVAPLDESSFGEEYEENNAKVQKHVQQEQNMIFDEKRDKESLSAQVEISFENVYNTDEENARDNNVSMVFDRGQGGEQSLSSQDESIFENIDNSTESHTIDTETCKYGESDFELQERLKQTESGKNERNVDEDSFELGEDHFEEGENIFEVISRPSEASNECFTNALVNTQKEDKLHQCDVCQKFVNRSTWWNHMLTHNDDMPFTCEFCWKYFKYKGSLSRHVKEQHYGLGRRGLKMALDKSLGSNISCSTQETDDLHKEIKSFEPIVKEESNSNEIITNRSMICDKMPGNDTSRAEYSSQRGVNNYRAILYEGDNRDSNLKERSSDASMIFDKRSGNNDSYFSPNKVNLGSTMKVNQKHLDTKHCDFDDAQSNNVITLPEGNVYMQENDHLNEDESSLQEAQQEERTLAIRQYQFDECHDNLENLPSKIMCEICGKCFRHKGSLTRHVKEQHYGLGRKSLKMVPDENQGRVNCLSSSDEDSSSFVSMNEVEYKVGDSKDTNVNPSVKFIASHENNDVKEETFEVKQSDFEMRESDENNHSEKDNFIKESSFENLFGEVDQEEGTLESQQDNFDDEQTDDATMVKEGFEQENDDLNKNGRSFEHDLQETDQNERKLASKQDSFDAHDDKFENSRRLEITCDFCGKYFKHQPSLCRHVKEQHYGLKRKSSRMLSSERQNNVNSSSSQKHGHLPDGFNNPEAILNDRNVNPGVKFIASHENIDVREETFEVKQSDFEMKESDENKHSEKDNFTKESSFENVLDEVDQEERTSGSQLDNCDDEQTDDATMVKEGFVQENDNLNKNGCRLEHDLQETDQEEERKLASKQDSFNAHDDKFTCDFCGKYFKHQPSLCRHVKQQHYGLKRKSSRMLSSERQNNVNSSSSQKHCHLPDGFNNPEAILNDRNVNPSVNYIASHGNVDVKDETFEVKQSDFEMKESDENKHSEKDNFTKESSFENVLDEVDQEERTSGSQQDNFDDEQTDDATMVKEGFVQENDNLNKNGCRLEHDLHETDQEERTSGSQQDNFDDEQTNDATMVKESFEQESDNLNKNGCRLEHDLHETDQEERISTSKQDSFNAHDDKLTCDFCGKYFKHQPSLCRHVKEQHYGLKRKSSRMLSSERQNNVNSSSSQKHGHLPDGFNNPEAILNDRNVNPSVKFIASHGNIDVKEETFEVKQSDFENVLDEVDQEDNFDDEQTNDATMMKEGFEQENDNLNMNGCSFEHDLQEIDQEERMSTSNQDSFNAYDDKLTCDFCGKYFKHQPSLCRHVKQQHYGLKRKSSRMLSSERQNNVNSSSSQKHFHLPDGFNNPEAILNDKNVNPSVNFITSQENISVREETFEVKQSDFEMKESDENIHSEKDNFTKESSFENVLDEIDQEERTSGSQQDNFDDEQTDDATMVKESFVQENDDLNKNGRSFEHDLQETDQEEERKLALQQDSFDAHDDKFENSRRLEITCDFCGKYFKHQPSLCRHVKEQHYGLKRKSSRMLSSERQNNVNSSSSQKHGHLPDGFNNPEAILNDNKDTNLKEKSCEPRLIFDERQGSENGCPSHGKDHLQNRLRETVKDVDEDYKDENSEQSNFEMKETSKHEQNHTVQKKENDFQQRLQEVDLEKRRLETKYDHVDICDSVEVNVSEGNKLFREVEVFKCKECPRIFQNRTALRKHKRVHCDEMSFTCEFCQQTFKYKGSLNRHVKEQHYGLGRKIFRKMSDERVASNNECCTVGKVNPGSIVNEVFYEDSNFTEENCEQYNFEERRIDNKQGGGDVAITSKEGNFSLQKKSTFKHKFYQKSNVDTKQKNFVHDRLERAKNKVQQEQSSFEMKNQNLKVKKIHRCVQCPRTFWNSSELREHSYKHTDVKSFACKLCGKAFKFRSGLVRHNRKEHKGNRLTQNVVSENNLGIHGSGEETLQHSTFENDLRNKEYSEFREGYGRIKPTKRKFSGGENDFKTAVDERSRIEKGCLNSESEDNSDFGEDVGAIVNENLAIQDRRFSLNEEISTQSDRQNLPMKKKPSVYKCNKCDATFKDLCDFLAHQRIHK